MPILRNLEHEVQSFLAGGCHLRTASKGCVVCEKGSYVDGFFFVVTGRIKLAVLSADGCERVIDILLPGCSFGESAALLQQPCPTRAEALSDSRLLFVEYSRVEEAIGRWPTVAVALLGNVARRVYELTRNLEECCLNSASQRVASFLLRDVGNRGCAEDFMAVELPAAKVVVASSLNRTAETFSRELHYLAREGIVDIERRTIRTLSPDRLRHRCEAV